jgi:integrase
LAVALNKLTDRACKAAKLPEGGKILKLGDGGSLSLIITPSGRRWELGFSWQGKRKALGLGAYPEVSLADARAEAEKARALVRAGVNPIEARHPRGLPTFNHFADELIGHIRANGRRGGTITRLDFDLAAARGAFGDKLMKDVTADEVKAVLAAAVTRGARSIVEPMRRTLSRVFQRAIAVDACQRDHAAALKGQLAEAKERRPRAAILDEEGFAELVRRIWSADRCRPNTASFLRLLVLSSVRPTELRAARWAEFDLGAALWTIPAERMKAGRKNGPHRVPLSPAALEELKALRARTGNHDYIFPGGKDGLGFISHATPVDALIALGYERGTISAHGFRASFSTIAHKATVELPDGGAVVRRWPSEVIEAALAHSDKDRVRASYRRDDYISERIELMTWWGRKVLGMVTAP